MKKKALLVIAALSMLLLPGCLASTYALTDEEMDIIAEYAAGVLLRNDEYYEEALVMPTPTPSPSPEPVLSPTPTPAPTQEPGKDGADGSSNSNKPPVQEEMPEANASLTEVYGLAGLEVKYKSASVVESHSEGAYRIAPADGKQLVRVYFTVSNVSGITQKINFGSLDIDYRLSCGEKSFALPKITAIDLLFLEAELPAGESMDCVLFFDIDQSSTIENADLIVSRGEEVSIISLNK